MAKTPKRLKPAQFEDRMTLVEHLDELRSRIVFSGIFLVLAIVLCFLFEDTLLKIANEPLPPDYLPTTLSPTEPFFTTVKLSVYGGILISLPVLLYQLYAFILPAFAPGERKLLLPFLLSVPVLFIGGAVFAYFVVMPAALDFLLGFNADSFDIQLRASEYYGFFILTLIAVAAMLLPGTDPVTMILSMAPLYLLFEFSLILARRWGRPPEGLEVEDGDPNP